MTLQKLSLYGKAFQLKVLGSLLTDKKFLLNVRDVLRADYFDSDTHKWIISQITEYFDHFHTVASMDVLKIELQKVENDVLKVAIKEELRNSYNASQEDITYIQEEFAAFCRNQEMKQAILQSADLLKEADFDGIRSLIEKALKAGIDKNIGHEYSKDIESRYRADARAAIPTPWPIVNDTIQGGWGPGDLIVLFGSPGSGKCVDYNTQIEIEYPEYGFELSNSAGSPFTMWIKPWDEFNIDGFHLFGWQAYNLLKD